MQAIERNKVGLALADLAENEGAGNGLKSLQVMEKVGSEREHCNCFSKWEKQQYQLAPELYRA